MTTLLCMIVSTLSGSNNQNHVPTYCLLLMSFIHECPPQQQGGKTEQFYNREKSSITQLVLTISVGFWCENWTSKWVL